MTTNEFSHLPVDQWFARRNVVCLVARAAAALILVVLMASCGGDDIAERVIESQLESESGEDVNVDLDDGDISITTEDGEFSINVDEDDDSVSISGSSDDGEFSIETENGETVIRTDEGTIIGSASGDLPDGFPTSVPVPDGLSIQASQIMQTTEGTAYVLSGILDGSPTDVAEQLMAALEGAGYEQVQVTNAPDGAFLVYDDGEHMVTAIVALDSPDDSTSGLSLTVTASPDS